jgi:hypothetical protein
MELLGDAAPPLVLLGFVTATVATVMLCFVQVTRREEGTESPPPYETLYPLNSAAEDVAETEANRAKGRVEEVTPSGRVVVQFRDSDSAFMYWSDRGDVQYKYLETVARKWAVVHDRREVYVNLYRELLDTPPPHKKKEKLNKYVWQGRLAELDPPPETKKEARCVSYAEFKKKL